MGRTNSASLCKRKVPTDARTKNSASVDCLRGNRRYVTPIMRRRFRRGRPYYRIPRDPDTPHWWRCLAQRPSPALQSPIRSWLVGRLSRALTTRPARCSDADSNVPRAFGKVPHVELAEHGAPQFLLRGRSAAPPCVRFSVLHDAVISGLRAHGSSALRALAQHADPRRPVEFRGRRL